MNEQNLKPMEWARRQPLRAPEKGVLRALAWRGGLTGVFPSVKQIAADEGLSERSVSDCLTRLEAAGLVDITRRILPTGKRGLNNYRLRFDRMATAEDAKRVHLLKSGSGAKAPSVARQAPPYASGASGEGASVGPRQLHTALEPGAPGAGTTCATFQNPDALGADKRKEKRNGKDQCKDGAKLSPAPKFGREGSELGEAGLSEQRRAKSMAASEAEQAEIARQYVDMINAVFGTQNTRVGAQADEPPWKTWTEQQWRDCQQWPVDEAGQLVVPPSGCSDHVFERYSWVASL
ncbi:helix-turn-helix domain-containing protein [Paucibacter sp. DJ1R-11]|uniref:helix-turn-helix domain-containing protein n=1 Tax=Paucibacter sp. DJ1R-11 TaxID=2893556 RepID=UPI0021E3CD16|nr:helix-turn-helix domain-containing protein [Paucibacter sp. DJ1R-11]MCV2362484.1 helix-turn-helix domain-containing protein [Paucibacter sp. DJ1R-11]